MASSNGNFPASMPVLKGKNYDDWCVQMKVIFRFRDVTEVVQEGVQELDRNSTDAQKVAHCDLKKRDANALFIIHQFDHIVVAIEQGQNLEEMKIEELQGILKAQEMRLNERNSQRSVEQAMQAQKTKGNNYDGGKNKKGKGKWKNNKWKGVR
ncbi:hypothetical protein JHK87_052864 [Glycine soja]|nr:hypothetical protein JHK87_052864 [Glycine soja]